MAHSAVRLFEGEVWKDWGSHYDRALSCTQAMDCTHVYKEHIEVVKKPLHGETGVT